MISGDQTQVSRLEQQALYPLSHLAYPIFVLLKLTSSQELASYSVVEPMLVVGLGFDGQHQKVNHQN